MNKTLINNELWPNNGQIMIEFNDIDLDFNNKNKILQNFKYIGRFIVIDTIHEDNLRWEEEFVLSTLLLNDSTEEYNKNKNYYNTYLSFIGEDTLEIKQTDRIALSEAFDWIFTEEDGCFIELSRKYNYLKFSVFTNESKTRVVFLGHLFD